MAQYAKIVDGKVENVIVAEQEWIDTQINDVYVKSTNENTACVDGFYIDGRFTLPQPYASWTRDGNGWKAPVSLPNDSYNHETGLGVIYMWNEGTLSWVPIPDAG